MEISKNKLYYQYIQNLRLIDDTFARVVFKNKDCVELLIQILFDDEELRVIHFYTQYEFKNIGGRSITVDLYVEDSKGRHINIEFQKDKKGASIKRARYHESMMDGHISFPREKWKEIPEVYVFFITEEDIFGYGKSKYKVERKIEEVNESFQDDEHIVYINGENIKEEKLGYLMHDLKCKEAKDMHYEVLAREVRHYKESEEGIQEMCEISRKIREDGEKEGISKGIKQGMSIGMNKGRRQGISKGKAKMRKEIVENMVKSGKFSYEDISLVTGMKMTDIITLCN